MFFNGATQAAFDAFVRSCGTGPEETKRWRRFVISLHQAGGKPDLWYVRYRLEESLGAERAERYTDLLERNLDSLSTSTLRIAR